jgi:tetratricopeptide (TPR) repeat protein
MFLFYARTSFYSACWPGGLLRYYFRKHMASRHQRFPAAALRITVICSCCWGIWMSWRLARGDYLFRQDTERSIRQAIAETPDASAYYTRLAEFEPADAQELLATAVRLDPYSPQADIELGLRDEAHGEFGRAEQWFLRAFAVDHTYLPRWSLAGFYFRRGNMTEFWAWARRAAEIPSDSTGSLFDLCWRASPDGSEITRRIVNNNPKLLRDYLDFLLTKDQPSSLAEIAIRLIQHGDPNEDAPRIYSAINRLIDDNDGESAKAIWTALIASHWEVAETGWPNNPKFDREPLPVGFDWTFPASSGIQSVPGPSGLETEFSGLEPEQCTIAEQAIVLSPGNYKMEYTYRAQGIAPETGLHWQIIAGTSGIALADSSDLSSETLTRAQMVFSVPRGISLVHLRLAYQRVLGTVPIAGELVVSSVQIHASSSGQAPDD